MLGFGKKNHGKKHPIYSTKDHKPEAGAGGDNIVLIDPTTLLPFKDSGIGINSLLGTIQKIDETPISTTALTPQIVKRETMTLETARYIVEWQQEIQGGGTPFADAIGEFEINGTPIGSSSQQQANYSVHSGLFVLNASAGSYDFDFILYRAGGAIAAVWSRRRRLVLRKVVE